ncbi:hypothetical protein [Photobacterium satsumensis]|uniref:hypothetical protein n=1 Tax=Photobacterium satsumensis TaxID=2910239 RepID=UPI003D09A996
MTEMAISNYLAGFLFIIACYPFCLVAVNIFFHASIRNKVSLWFNLACLLLLAFLLYMHMQVEVIYGQELLDAWYKGNPDN